MPVILRKDQYPRDILLKEYGSKTIRSISKRCLNGQLYLVVDRSGEPIIRLIRENVWAWSPRERPRYNYHLCDITGSHKVFARETIREAVERIEKK
jgi:hypothetical protein